MVTNEEYPYRGGLPAQSTRRETYPIRGRDAERRAVGAAVGAILDGRGDVVVVRGAPGVGKSRLLEDAHEQAVAAGLRPVIARTDRDSHLIPLAPIMDAFRAGDRPVFDRDRLGAGVLDPEARYWLLQALQDDLERAAQASGVAVFVDDLQWCDTSTLAMLRSLADHLTDVPVLWVVAVRADEPDPSLAATVTALGALGTVLDLEPLTPDATAAMVGDLLRATPDERVLETARRADNVPLLLVELVRGLLDEDLVVFDAGVASMPAPVLPTTFGASVRENLRRLGPAAQQVVQVGALLGRTFGVRGLTAMTDLTVHQLVAALQEAIHAGIIVDRGDEFAFRHDVLREVAESTIPKAVRDVLLRQAVETLLRQGVEPLSVAARIAEVAEPGDLGAVDVLLAAATDLAATDAAQASALALRAADIARPTVQLPEVVAAILPLLWQSGRLEDARGLTESLGGRMTGADDARLRLATARLQTEAAPLDALRSLDEALEHEGLGVALRVRLLALKSLNLAYAGDHETMRATLGEARPLAEATADAIATATLEASESVLAFTEGRFADATRSVTSAIRRVAGAPASASEWLPEGLWAAFLANSLGDTGRAGRIAEANAIETGNNHMARAMAMWMMVRTRVLFDQGALEDAKTLGESALDLAVDLELGSFAAATAGAVLFRIGLVQADRAAVTRHRHHVDALVANPASHLAGRWLLALEADSLGAVEAAGELTDDAWRTLGTPVASMSSPADFADDVHLLRMSLRAGAHERLADIERASCRRSERNPDNDLCAGIALQVRGLVHRSVPSLRDAVVRLRAVDRRLVLAAALEDLGCLLRSGSEAAAGAEAVDAWHEAAELFHRSSATRDAERVRRRLRDTGVLFRTTVGEQLPSGLTSRELQVVERVAAGLTTQQIASDLFISSHTVISHVRHVYAKWGVSSRRALAERFTRDPGGRTG